MGSGFTERHHARKTANATERTWSLIAFARCSTPTKKIPVLLQRLVIYICDGIPFRFINIEQILRTNERKSMIDVFAIYFYQSDVKTWRRQHDNFSSSASTAQ